MKKIMGGVDTMANPVLTLHEQTLSFFIMRQGQSESDEDYLQRFDAWAKSLELVGGEQYFCSSQVINKKIEDATPEIFPKNKNASEQCVFY